MLREPRHTAVDDDVMPLLHLFDDRLERGSREELLELPHGHPRREGVVGMEHAERFGDPLLEGLQRSPREDEAVVEATHRGLKSGFYTRGRYSPARETGPHHFHRMAVQALKG